MIHLVLQRYKKGFPKIDNADYEESLLSSSLPDKKLNVSGVVVKIVAAMQECIELISESQFQEATNLK